MYQTREYIKTRLTGKDRILEDPNTMLRPANIARVTSASFCQFTPLNISVLSLLWMTSITSAMTPNAIPAVVYFSTPRVSQVNATDQWIKTATALCHAHLLPSNIPVTKALHSAWLNPNPQWSTDSSSSDFQPVVSIPAASTGVFPTSLICGFTKSYCIRYSSYRYRRIQQVRSLMIGRLMPWSLLKTMVKIIKMNVSARRNQNSVIAYASADTEIKTRSSIMSSAFRT